MAQLIFIAANIIAVAYGTYGYRRSNGSIHWGIDISTNGDPTIHSTVSGRVKHALYIPKGTAGWGNTWEWGWFVWIIADDGTDHIFAHCKMNSLRVKKGQRVTKGQAIATMGNTGNAAYDSQGSHVHYEVRRNGKAIDPTPWCGIPNKKGTYYNENKPTEKGQYTMKIITPMENTVSSQMVKEGVLAVKGADGIVRGYNTKGEARMVRQCNDNTLSATYESMSAELQNNEMIFIEQG